MEELKSSWTKEVWGYIIGVFLISTLLRLIPHPPNVTPIGGIAILSGVYLKGYLRYLLPIIPMILSDLYLGFSSITLWVYLSFMMITLWSQYRKDTSIGTVFGSSMIFFCLSNLGVYLLGGYGYTFEGLILCYTMALPFLTYTLIGDVIWTYTLKGIVEYPYLKKIVF
jgi:hypothetical protein